MRRSRRGFDSPRLARLANRAVSERYFTLEEANGCIARLNEVMRQLLQLHGHLRTMCRDLTRDGINVSPETFARGREIQADAGALQRINLARGMFEAVRETMGVIERMGAIVKDVESGLVDFPSWLDGRREVLLCWRIGETKIDWYHDTEAGFSGRRPVEGLRFAAERSE